MKRLAVWMGLCVACGSNDQSKPAPLAAAATSQPAVAIKPPVESVALDPDDRSKPRVDASVTELAVQEQGKQRAITVESAASPEGRAAAAAENKRRAEEPREEKKRLANEAREQRCRAAGDER